MGLRDLFQEDTFRDIGQVAKKVGGVLATPFRPREIYIQAGDGTSPATPPQAQRPPRALAAMQAAAVQRFQPRPQPIVEAKRNVPLSQDDINELRRIVFSEVSNRSVDKQDLETRVLLNTALNRVAENRKRGTHLTLRDVLTQPNQYQGYGTTLYKAYDRPHDVLTKERKRRLDAIIDNMVKEIEEGRFEDNTGGAFFYVHKGDKIYYDNKPLFR